MSVRGREGLLLRRSLVLGVDEPGYLRFLARRRVRMDDAFGRRLVELLDGRCRFLFQLLQRALFVFGDFEYGLELLLEGLLGSSIVLAPLDILPQPLLATCQMRHRLPFNMMDTKSSLLPELSIYVAGFVSTSFTDAISYGEFQNDNFSAG